MSLAVSSTGSNTSPAPIKIAWSAHPSRPTLPVSAPPSPPPPPSPASLSPSHLSTPLHHQARPTHLLRRATTLRPPQQPRPKFDLESSSPLSPSGADKTLLLARLERAESTQVLLREGQPARPLTSRELRRLRHEEAGESSSTAGGASGEGGGTTGTEDVDDGSTPVSRASTPSVCALDVPQAAFEVEHVEHVELSAGQVVGEPGGHPSPSVAQSLPSISRSATLVPSTSSRPSRTAPFPSLLSRRAQSSTHLDPAHAQATPLTSRTSPSTTFGGHVLALKLAEAAAAQQSRQRAGPAPRRSASPASPATAPGQGPSPSKATAARKQQLGKTRSLPAAAQSAPATPWLGPSAHSRSSTAPMPPPSFVFPPDYRPHARTHTTGTTTSSRASSSSISSSPQSSPLLRPVVTSSVASGDPSALTLHFARRPDMSRKGSLGESWSRLCMRGEHGRATAKGVFGSWGSAAGQAHGSGMVRGASDAETEEESGEGESGAEGDDEDFERSRVNASELSVFASPRSSFASSFFTSPLSRSRSLSSTQDHDDHGSSTPSASAPSSAASPTSSSPPKLPLPAKLGGSAGPHAPRGRWEDIVAASEPTLLPLPVLAPVHAAPLQPSALLGLGAAAGTAPPRPSAHAAAAGLEMKKLRADQAARRLAVLGPQCAGGKKGEGDGEGDVWESSSSASEDEAEGESSGEEREGSVDARGSGSKKGVEQRGRVKGGGRRGTLTLRRG